MDVQEASGSALLPSIHDSKTPQKNSALDSSKSPKRKYNILTVPALLTSNGMPPTRKPTLTSDFHRVDSLTSWLSTEKLQFIPPLASVFSHSHN